MKQHRPTLAIKPEGRSLRDKQLSNGRLLALDGAAWRKLRAMVLSEQPLCEMCERQGYTCLLYTSPSPRDRTRSRMPSSA